MPVWDGRAPEAWSWGPGRFDVTSNAVQNPTAALKLTSRWLARGQAGTLNKGFPQFVANLRIGKSPIAHMCETARSGPPQRLP